MRKRITQFLLDDFQRGYLFKKMCREIGMEFDMSAGMVWKCGENAITEWESAEGREISNIFILDNESKNQEIGKILGFFRNNVGQFVPLNPKLGKSFKIAENTLNSIFSRNENGPNFNFFNKTI